MFSEIKKNLPNIFQVSIHSDLLCLWPEALIDSFVALVIIYNKTRQLFYLFLLSDKHFWVLK